MGIENICAVDGNQKRLDLLREWGADTRVNFMEYKGIEALTKLQRSQGGHLADFAFSAQDHRSLMQTFTNSAMVVDFVNLVSSSMVGRCNNQPQHFDLCPKEINLVGSWVYT